MLEVDNADAPSNADVMTQCGEEGYCAQKGIEVHDDGELCEIPSTLIMKRYVVAQSWSSIQNREIEQYKLVAHYTLHTASMKDATCNIEYGKLGAYNWTHMPILNLI